MPEPFHIRQLEVGDAADYRAFRLRALREHADAFTSSFEEENVRVLGDTESRLRATAAGKLWGAYMGGQLVGMVGLSLDGRIKIAHKGSLVGMYLAPGHTGRGIGWSLVRTVQQAAQDAGLELLTLTVTESNQPATALYEKCGFKPFGTEPDAVRVNGTSFGKTHMFLSIKNN